MKTQPGIITLYGNLGGDPQLKTIAAKDYTREVYDPIIDEVVERHFTGKDKEFYTFSIAINAKDPETGVEVTRWIRCTDWKGNSKLLRKGDRVAVKGFLKDNVYEKDGERIVAKDLNVLEISVQKRKVRGQAE